MVKDYIDYAKDFKRFLIECEFPEDSLWTEGAVTRMGGLYVQRLRKLHSPDYWSYYLRGHCSESGWQIAATALSVGIFRHEDSHKQERLYMLGRKKSIGHIREEENCRGYIYTNGVMKVSANRNKITWSIV
jgi:hypothetical protein